MEQAESNPDSPRVFTTEKWFVQLGMAAHGIACWSSVEIQWQGTKRMRRFELLRRTGCESWIDFRSATSYASWCTTLTNLSGGIGNPINSKSEGRIKKSGDTSRGVVTQSGGAVKVVRSRISHRKCLGESEYDTRNAHSVGPGGS